MLNYQRTKRQRLMNGIRKLPGLVLYHPLNETSGTIAYNYAPANLGTYNTNLTSGGTVAQKAHIGRGYALDGTASYLDLPSQNAFGSLANCSIFTLMQLTAGGTNFMKPFFKNGVYDFGINNSGQPFVEIVGVYNQGQFSGGSFFDNRAHIMAITDRTGTVSTYIDGTQASSTFGTDTPTVQNTNDIAYGKNLGNGKEFVQGTIQHYAFLNQGLTVNQYRKLSHLGGFI